MKQRILSILVDNSSGALTRVSGLFARRGYNIDSLTVGVTADPKYSRMTVVASGADSVLEQITKQLSKLVDVRDIKVLKPDKSVTRELIMVKVRADATHRQDIMTIAEIYKARLVDVDPESVIVEVTGTQNKLDAILTLLSEFEILELARTGLTGLSRGTKDVRYLD